MSYIDLQNYATTKLSTVTGIDFKTAGQTTLYKAELTSLGYTWSN